jgi:hypothetical protein
MQLRYAVILSAFFGFAACNDEISMIYPGPPVPVVYGVFDVNNPMHYIKLTKSFIGEEDPRELAAEHGNMFYDSARVYLYRYSDTDRSYFELKENLARNTGYFPSLPNEAFVLNKKLTAGYYMVRIQLPEDGDTLTARFAIIDALKVLLPKAGLKRFYFYEDPTVFAWMPHPGAGLYELSFILTYQESLKSGENQFRTLRFNRQLRPETLEVSTDRYVYRYYSDAFFASIGTQVPYNEEVEYRKALNLDIELTAADTTLARYINWYSMEIDDKNNPNGNVAGAIGVIGSKYTVTFPGLSLSDRSQDSLIRGRYTRDLGFVSNSNW